ncbi:DUF4442 domain-containing protein [Flavobacteriales bacterium]|nr:DUF4442 domain-containing protein [Flavobacteriales bacterium]
MFSINYFLFFKLPSAYWSGVRVKSIDNNECVVSVKLNWFNKNPFKSIFWAVQGMAAELSTGMLVSKQINDRKINVSMLVISSSSNFYKKAVGRIKFNCIQGNELKNIFDKLDEKNPTNKITMFSRGIDEVGDVVSDFKFEWSFKRKF